VSWRSDDGIASSEEIAIEIPAPAAALSLALDGAHPIQGSIVARVGLASSEPARLELFDIGGRRVAAQVVAGTSGRVEVQRSGSFAPGLYWLRLSQGARSVSTRLVVVQ
jgi:hypothetical protein